MNNMRNKILMTLALLLTAVTAAAARQRRHSRKPNCLGHLRRIFSKRLFQTLERQVASTVSLGAMVKS